MKKGFTLIELMIVLAIVAILAAVSIPLYGMYKERAIRAEAEQELMNIQTIQEDHFNSYRRYTTVEDDLKNYYGARVGNSAPDSFGKNFYIDLDGDATAYVATAYVCYEKAGSACNSGNDDLTCTISAGMEKPNCN